MGDRVPDDGMFDGEEVDLREYVRVILRHAGLIVGLGIVAALAGLVVSSALPRRFEATTLVAVTKPPYTLNFDPRLSTAPDIVPPSKALMALATTDEMLATVLSSASAALPADVRTVEDLREALTAASTSDPSLVALKARAGDPKQASTIANAWADAVVARAREVYGQTQGDTAYFEARLAEAGDRLGKAEAALAEHQGKSELRVLADRLNALQSDQQSYLAERATLDRLTVDVEGFRAQVGKYPADARVTPGDDLIAFLLQNRAFDSDAPLPSRPDGGSTGAASSPQVQVVNPGAAPRIQLQVGAGEVLSGKKAGELQQMLDDLGGRLRTKRDAIDARLSESKPRILELQGQVQRLQNETDRLTLERDVARETYQGLARKTEETRIAALGAKGQIRVASQAVPPVEPVSANRARNTAAGGALGLLAGLVGAFAWEWWRRGEAASPRERLAAEPATKAAAEV